MDAGAVVAGRALQQDEESRARIKDMLAAIAAQQWRQQQFEQTQQQAKMLDAAKVDFERQRQSQLQPPPQPMAPGQPSQPMMQPPTAGTPPAGMQAPGGAGGLMQLLASGMAPGGGGPQAAPQPQAAPSPPPVPQGFTPIAGGQFAPPIGGAPTPGTIGTPPPPPSQEGPILPPSLMDPEKAFKIVDKMNVPDNIKGQLLDHLAEQMNAQVKTKFEGMRLQIEMKRAEASAAREARLEAAGLQGKTDPEIARTIFAAGGDPKKPLEQQPPEVLVRARKMAQAEEARKGEPHRTTVNVGGGAGVGPLKNVEYIYPKGPDGKIDESKGPIGTRGLTKSGKMVVLDADGNESTLGALAGGTAKESKDSKVGVTNVVRQNIVKAGVTNSLARLDEIEKKFPESNTSAFFGTHGDNPLTRGAYGAGRGMMSSTAKQVDAAWASLIDEAIPVFTGGLRGSDAFRRFLIEQAPGPGDDKSSRKEKIRLLRANINGTSKAFFNKFASDPSFWGPDTKPQDVEAAKAETAPKDEWKVEKVQ